MITTTDFKRGARIVVDGDPFQIEDYQVQTPSARGAATLVRCKLRHIVTGSLLDKTFKSGEKFEEPDVAFRQIAIDQMAERLDPRPLLLGVRPRDPWRLVDAAYRHIVRERHFAFIQCSRDRRGAEIGGARLRAGRCRHGLRHDSFDLSCIDSCG